MRATSIAWDRWGHAIGSTGSSTRCARRCHGKGGPRPHEGNVDRMGSIGSCPMIDRVMPHDRLGLRRDARADAAGSLNRSRAVKFTGSLARRRAVHFPRCLRPPRAPVRAPSAAARPMRGRRSVAMSSEPEFLTIEDVIECHRVQLERWGGSDGIRDLGSLESAVMQPQAASGGSTYMATCFSCPPRMHFILRKRRRS
jgi:hypothetical protein